VQGYNTGSRHVSRVEETRNAYKILTRKSERENHLRDLVKDGNMT
jgi:hypothetical protein